MSEPVASMPRVGSFEEFFTTAWPWAYRLAALFTQDRAAGEEIAQDVLVRMYATWGNADQPEAYLRRSLVNAAQNWHRHNRMRQAKLPLIATSDHVDFAADELADIVNRLPFRQRAVVVLRYYGGFSEAEIAEALSCRPGTVKSLSSRALTRLAKETPR